jgi:hypothetical protein
MSGACQRSNAAHGRVRLLVKSVCAYQIASCAIFSAFLPAKDRLYATGTHSSCCHYSFCQRYCVLVSSIPHLDRLTTRYGKDLIPIDKRNPFFVSVMVQDE